VRDVAGLGAAGLGSGGAAVRVLPVTLGVGLGRGVGRGVGVALAVGDAIEADTSGRAHGVESAVAAVAHPPAAGTEPAEAVCAVWPPLPQPT
jgi:hypothetical protein